MDATKVSRVNITEDKFNIDGMVAEMIIEVDTDTSQVIASPMKSSAGPEDQEKIIDEITTPSGENENTSKLSFARKLGLMCPKYENNESLTADTTKVKQEIMDDFDLLSEAIMTKGNKGKRKVKTVFLRQLPLRNKNTKSTNPGHVKERTDAIGDGVKLGDIIEIYNRIKTIKTQGLRPLYRLLFYRWPSEDINEVKRQILQFSGFPFDQKSYDFEKRKKMLKVCIESSLRRMCVVLGMKPSTRTEMMQNIMHFLLKPTLTLDPSIDIKLQPIVSLRSLDIDKDIIKKVTDGVMTYSLKKKEKISTSETQRSGKKKNEVQKKEVSGKKVSSKSASSKNVSVKESSHKNIASKEISSKKLIPRVVVVASTKVSPKEVSQKKISPKGVIRKESASKEVGRGGSPSIQNTVIKRKPGRPPLIKPKPDHPLIKRKAGRPPFIKPKPGRPVKRLNSLQTDVANKRLKAATLVHTQRKVFKGRRTRLTAPLPKDVSDKSSDSEKETKEIVIPVVKRVIQPYKKGANMARRSADKRKRPNHYGDWINDDEPYVAVQKPKLDPKITKVPEVQPERKIEKQNYAEEEEEVAEEPPPTIEKPKEVIKGKRLDAFPSVNLSIDLATSSVLQRLHVILYGTSDQPEEMKKNLKQFDGFKFEPGSEEWNQKKFLLSLVSMNYLREYVEVLRLEGCNEPNTSPNTLIEILMNFLMAPRANLLMKAIDDRDLEEYMNLPPNAIPMPTIKRVPMKPKPKAIVVPKPKPQKKPEKPKTGGSRRRKVLMDESEVRKLELEIAREERAKRRSMVHPPGLDLYQSLPHSANDFANSQAKSMLTMIHNNRALKAVGVDPITPLPSNRITKLGDNNHVKFMIVALNYPDLDIIHNLIFLHDAVKARIRRNILDFGGFKFDETSPKYKFRETVLQRLGENIVKRIAFIFGLTPLNTTLSLIDLTDLIMHFLMSPSRIKQVPIKEFPPNFFQDYPRTFKKEEIFQGMPKDAFQERTLLSAESILLKTTSSKPEEQSQDVGIPFAEVITSDPVTISQERLLSKAPPVALAPKQVGTPPPKNTAPPTLILQPMHKTTPQMPGQIIMRSPAPNLNPSVTSSSMNQICYILNTTAPSTTTANKSNSPASLQQSMPQTLQLPFNFMGKDGKGFPPGQQIILYKISPNAVPPMLPPQRGKSPAPRVVQGSSSSAGSPVAPGTTFRIQGSSALSSAGGMVRPPMQGSPVLPSPSSLLRPPSTNLHRTPLPTAIRSPITFKPVEPLKPRGPTPSFSNMLNATSSAPVQNTPVQSTPVKSSARKTVTPLVNNIKTTFQSNFRIIPKNTARKAIDDYILPPSKTSIAASEPPEEICLSDSDDESIEEIEPEVVDNTPSEQQLFLKIRDIVHSSNMEDITLKKVSEKLLHAYPIDTSRYQDFIKSSIKKSLLKVNLGGLLKNLTDEGN